MRFPHTHFSKGKRVVVRLRDGSTLTGRFVQRRARFVVLDSGRVATKHIAHMGFSPMGGGGAEQAAESAGSGGAGGVKPCNVLVAIGKPCRNCGGEIKARHKERKWALKKKDFCCNRCGILWNVKTRDNAQVTAAMRAASHTPEAQAKRTAGLKNSHKIAAAMAKTAAERANAEAIRLAVTKPCACGCGTVIPTIGVDGTESFWVRGHDKRVPGCKEREKERVPTGTLCVVCEAPILARRKEVRWAAKKRHCCSDACSLVLAQRAVTPEQKARMIEQLKARIAADPRLCAGLGHHSVKPWRLRNPSNVIYEFRNLRLFIMEHEALFAPEDVEWRNTKKGMQCRALYGLCGLSMRRATVSGSWKGWTWHSQTERLKNDGRDLLERRLVSSGGGGEVVVCDDNGESKSRAQGYNAQAERP